MDKTLVIMAAGMGSRYGGLKQIDPVGPNGEIIIEYSVFDAIKSGFNKVVFIIKEENEKLFKEVIGDKISDKIKVEYVFQKTDYIPGKVKVPEGREKPWGTAHAIMCCKGVVNEPFAVINADDFYGREAFSKISDFLSSVDVNGTAPYKFCMAGYVLKNTLTENGYVSRGVCEADENNELVSVTERTKIMKKDGVVCFEEKDKWIPIDENSIVSMNCWGLTPAFIETAENGFEDFLRNSADIMKSEYYLPSVVSSMIEKRTCAVRILKTEEKWIGVTYKEDKAAVKQAIQEKVQNGIYPSMLWK